MADVTHEQANLMLKLYDLRREAKLREARDWFAANFHVKNAEEAMRLCPFGSIENTPTCEWWPATGKWWRASSTEG